MDSIEFVLGLLLLTFSFLFIVVGYSIFGGGEIPLTILFWSFLLGIFVLLLISEKKE